MAGVNGKRIAGAVKLTYSDGYEKASNFAYMSPLIRFCYTARVLRGLLSSIIQLIKQTLAGILEEFEGKLEVAIRAVIRIWNGLLAWMMTEIVAHADNLLKISRRIGLTSDIVIVLVIHDGDEIETLEIPWRELAGSMIEGVPMSLSALSHPIVRQLTYVPGPNTCGIDEKLILESSLSHQMMHDTISSWRTTDITQTDKQNLLHFERKVTTFS